MKIKEGFVLREIAGKAVVIAVGEASKTFHGMINLNSEGDFLAWDYDVYEECCAVVHISKKPFHWGDTYVIDILDPKDEIMALMLAIAIDAANCTNK